MCALPRKRLPYIDDNSNLPFQPLDTDVAYIAAHRNFSNEMIKNISYDNSTTVKSSHKYNIIYNIAQQSLYEYNAYKRGVLQRINSTITDVKLKELLFRISNTSSTQYKDRLVYLLRLYKFFLLPKIDTVVPPGTVGYYYMHEDGLMYYRYKLDKLSKMYESEYKRFISLYLRNRKYYLLPIHDLYVQQTMRLILLPRRSQIYNDVIVKYNWTHALVDELINLTNEQKDHIYLQVGPWTDDTYAYIHTKEIPELGRYRLITYTYSRHNFTEIVDSTIEEIKLSIKWAIDNLNKSTMDNTVIDLLDIYRRYKHLIEVPVDETINDRLQYFSEPIDSIIDSKNIHIVSGLLSDIQYLVAYYTIHKLYKNVIPIKYDKLSAKMFVSAVSVNASQSLVYRQLNRLSIYLGECVGYRLYNILNVVNKV